MTLPLADVSLWGRLADRVREFINSLSAGSVVADVGCGNGKYFGVRSDIAVLGSDRSPGLAQVWQCSQLLNAWLQLSSIGSHQGMSCSSQHAFPARVDCASDRVMASMMFPAHAAQNAPSICRCTATSELTCLLGTRCHAAVRPARSAAACTGRAAFAGILAGCHHLASKKIECHAGGSTAAVFHIWHCGLHAC